MSLSDGPAASQRPYAVAACTWFEAGMEPVPGDGKGVVPRRVMGYQTGVIDEPQVRRWVEARRDRNVALRLTDIIGIDIDNYEHGQVHVGDAARSQARLEELWGALPGTLRTSARFGSDYDGVTGVRLFRLPPGRDEAYHHLQYHPAWTLRAAGIDLLRRCHRQVVV